MHDVGKGRHRPALPRADAFVLEFNVPLVVEIGKSLVAVEGGFIWSRHLPDHHLLTEQMLVNDPVWTAFLRRLRHGRLAEPDMSMLDSLVLTNILCPRTDFATEPWKDACLVTPRHAVREAWNNAATERMCIETGAVMFIIQAEDTVGKREVNRFERLEIAQQPSDQRRQIPPAEIILAIGMKVGHINSLS